MSSKLTKEIREIVINGLKACSTRESVADLFHKYEIAKNADKIKLLNKAMGNAETFYSQPMDEDAKLHREVSILLTGAWKINEYYDRAGL